MQATALARESTRATSALRDIIGWKDEHDLRWYFGEAQAVFERSPTGATIDRAELYAWRHVPQAWPEWIGRDEPIEFVLNAAGHIIGRRSAVTVRITSEERPAGGRSPNLSHIERYAKVSRRLLHAGVQTKDVLGDYYGDHGEGYTATRIDRHGKAVPPLKGMDRLCALYARTPMGQRWLVRCEAKRVEKKQPDLGLSSNQRMYSEIVVSITKRDDSDVRRKAMAQIKAEALAMYRFACCSWNGATVAP